MKAILEVAILLDKFRNIDLAQQGLYQLQVSVICEKTKTKAQPVNFNSFSSKKRQNDILPGSMDEEKIRSQVFLVRYADEKVRINEWGEFYVEIDLDLFDGKFKSGAGAGLQNENKIGQMLEVRVELCYSELGTKSTNHVGIQEDLVVLATKFIKVSNVLGGIVEYLPVNFEDKWFCSVKALIMVGFYDYKIPSSDLGVFASFLFADSTGNLKERLMNDEIDQTWEVLISKLTKVQTELKGRFEEISSACFIEDIQLPNQVENRGTFQSFAQQIEVADPLKVTEKILHEIKTLAGSIYENFNYLKKIISGNSHKVCMYLERKYYEKLKDRFSDFVRKEELGNSWKFDICSSEETKKDHKRKAKLLRKSGYFKNLVNLQVQEEGLWGKIKKQPILFEESSLVQNPISVEKFDFHLIVLVHGFQGNSFDLRLLRNYISLAYPKAVFLESSINESKTEGDIREMGSRLSREVISYLTYSFPDKSPKVSFIGHSMGGLIIRAALPFLDCLSDRFHLFLSLSTPHLGLMYSSKILDAGIWLLKRMKKSKSIKQLCFEDYNKVQGTALFMMSKDEGLQWFKYVVLVASLKDEYAPFDSARIEVPIKASKDPERGNFYIQMAHNILQKLTRQNIVKLDVHFKLKKSIETIIGRSAHLQILENESFLKILVFHYPEFFR